MGRIRHDPDQGNVTRLLRLGRERRGDEAEGQRENEDDSWLHRGLPSSFRAAPLSSSARISCYRGNATGPLTATVALGMTASALRPCSTSARSAASSCWNSCRCNSFRSIGINS